MALKSQVFSTTVNHYTLELTVVEDSNQYNCKHFSGVIYFKA